MATQMVSDRSLIVKPHPLPGPLPQAAHRRALGTWGARGADAGEGATLALEPFPPLNNKKADVFLFLIVGLLFAGGTSSFGMSQSELGDPGKGLARSRDPLGLVESFLVNQETGAVRDYRENLIARGKDEAANRVRFLEELYAGNNGGALQALELMKKRDAWVTSREQSLRGLLEIQRSFTETKSDHFIVRTSSENAFLAPYALPALESVYGRVAEFFASSPTAPVVIEIYPTLDTFAEASTLSKDTIERTGAVVTTRYGRMMVLSPGATAFGFPWLDGIVQEYVHRHLVHITGGFCPLWLQNGAARYLEVAWRRPAGFAHTPSDRHLLTAAVLSDTGTAAGVLTFSKMDSPFFALETQDQVALAFAEASDTVDFMVQEFGMEKLRALLLSFRGKSRAAAFQESLGMSEQEFEKSWRESLADLTELPTDLARGALGPSIRFLGGEDVVLVSEKIRARLILGDQFTQQGRLEGAVIEFKRAVELEPDNGVALARLARIYVTENKTQSAEELLKRAMEKNPAYAPSFVMMGNIYFDDGRYEEAQNVLQHALEINPFQSKIHEILGLIAVDVGNFALARQSLDLALRFDPINVGVRQSLEHMPKPR